MGRPKGSKNKPKFGTPGSMVVLETKFVPLPDEYQDKKAQLNKEQVELLAAKPKRTRKAKEVEPTDKATLKAQMNAPISPAELKQLRQEAAENMAKVVDPQLVVNLAVSEVIKPNWDKTPQDAAGLRHFLVKTIRHGEAVSFNKERWDAALVNGGVRGKLEACKPEGSAEVEPQANQAGGTTSLWRVMIG